TRIGVALVTRTYLSTGISRHRHHRDFKRFPIYGGPDRDLVVAAFFFFEPIDLVADAHVLDDSVAHVLKDRLDGVTLRKPYRRATLAAIDAGAFGFHDANLIGDAPGGMGIEQRRTGVQAPQPDGPLFQRELLDVAVAGPPVHAFHAGAGGENQFNCSILDINRPDTRPDAERRQIDGSRLQRRFGLLLTRCASHRGTMRATGIPCEGSSLPIGRRW